MTALLLIVPLTGIYPFFVMQALCFALLACAFNLLIGYGGLLSFGHAMFLGTAGYFHGACAEGLGPAARTRNPGRHRRRRRAWRHHRPHRYPPSGHLFLDDHAGAVAAVVFHLSADAVHPWRGRHPGHSAGLSVRNFQSLQPDDALLRHPRRLPVRLPADLPHHQLAVRRGAEGDPRERAARDLARLQDRPIQAARLYPVRHAGGLCRRAEGVRRAECLADRRALEHVRAKSC